MMKLKIISFFLFIFLLNSCGFKVIDQSELYNFQVEEIDTSGDKYISYKLKNKILSRVGKSENSLVSLDLDIEKIKTIKEKNIKNEIVEYAINIKVNVNFKESKNNLDGNFKITNTKGYTVSKKYSETLNNEMRLINVMTQKIAEDIIKELSLRVNDF